MSYVSDNADVHTVRVGDGMKCWYLIDTICDRPPGHCTGCKKYEDWRKERDEIENKIEEVIKRHKETLDMLAEDD